jgi:glycyl-tRNA synthetase beta chain
MVGEFPELQGLMGGYYAAAQGEHPAVAAAIRDHYKPVGQGDEVPTDPVTVAVSLADKLDNLLSFFAIGDRPSGSRDPFALRRAALGALALLVNSRGVAFSQISKFHRTLLVDTLKSLGTFYRVIYIGDHLQLEVCGPSAPLREGVWCIGADDPIRLKNFAAWNPQELRKRINLLDPEDVCEDVWTFVVDRLKVQQREAGVRHDLIDAVFALGGEDDLVRLLARVRALQAFVGTENGANLLAGYKRAANILKKEGVVPSGAPANAGAQGNGADGRPGPLTTQQHGVVGEAPSYTPEPAEDVLRAALDSAEPAAAAAVASEDFERAMAALATLRAPIDAFFESVTVNDADTDKRAARLALLDRVRAAVHQVADFSRIEG